MSDHSIYLRVSGVYVQLLSWRLTPPPTYVGLGRFQYGPNVISVHVTETSSAKLMLRQCAIPKLLHTFRASTAYILILQTAKKFGCRLGVADEQHGVSLRVCRQRHQHVKLGNFDLLAVRNFA